MQTLNNTTAILDTVDGDPCRNYAVLYYMNVAGKLIVSFTQLYFSILFFDDHCILTSKLSGTIPRYTFSIRITNILN